MKGFAIGLALKQAKGNSEIAYCVLFNQSCSNLAAYQHLEVIWKSQVLSTNI